VHFDVGVGSAPPGVPPQRSMNVATTCSQVSSDAVPTAIAVRNLHEIQD
jgi:hypothetical protein